MLIDTPRPVKKGVDQRFSHPVLKFEEGYPASCLTIKLHPLDLGRNLSFIDLATIKALLITAMVAGVVSSDEDSLDDFLMSTDRPETLTATATGIHLR